MLKRHLRGTRMDATAYLDMMGFDFIAEVEFRVTYWGCKAQTYGPPENCYPAEGPEWEVDAIYLRDDRVGRIGPEFEATGALLDVLAECDAVTEAIEREIADGQLDYDDY